MDNAEHNIERDHQVVSRLLALTWNIKRYEAKNHAQLKAIKLPVILR